MGGSRLGMIRAGLDGGEGGQIAEWTGSKGEGEDRKEWRGLRGGRDGGVVGRAV